MELRRPTLADKETILSMVAEFEETQSAHDGGFWDAEAFVYEAWLESNRDMEMGLGIPEGWVPAVQLVAFAKRRSSGWLSQSPLAPECISPGGGWPHWLLHPSL